MNLISTTVLIQKIEVGHPLTKLHNNSTEYTNVTDLISLYMKWFVRRIKDKILLWFHYKSLAEIFKNVKKIIVSIIGTI